MGTQRFARLAATKQGCMRNYVLIVLLGLIPLGGIAQLKMEGSIVVGGIGYQGDLTPDWYPPLQSIRPMLGLAVRHYFTPVWAVRGIAWWGQAAGDDAYFPDNAPHRQRGYSFRTTIGELDLLLDWDPWGKSRYPESRYRFRPRITPYLTAGVGASFQDVQTTYASLGEQALPPEVAIDQQENGSQMHLALPAGGGIKIDMSKKSTLALELIGRTNLNDLLDGVSASGNAAARDWYWTGQAQLTLRFGPRDSDGDTIIDKEDRCPSLPGVASARGCPDADGDGVEDAEDVCPDLAGLAAFSGCPDTDGDEIMDPVDQCPTAFGFEDTGGCPDGDNDCVIDSRDRCPEEAGLAALLGCPDTDGDGLADCDDPCPQEAGLPGGSGCPLPDTDCDGVLDYLDACPEIPDTTTLSGCPDRDGDGIIDLEDRCPNKAGSADRQGCPEIAEQDKRVLTLAMKAVQFKTGSSVLLPASRKILNQVADILARYPEYHLRIAGHTDSQGKASSNLVLSQRRAKACLDYLLAAGADPGRMNYAGYGEEQPIAENTTASGRLLNRRVEFILDIPQGEQQ